MSELRRPIVFISYSHLDEPEKPAEGEVQWLTFAVGFLHAGGVLCRGVRRPAPATVYQAYILYVIYNV